MSLYPLTLFASFMNKPTPLDEPLQQLLLKRQDQWRTMKNNNDLLCDSVRNVLNKIGEQNFDTCVKELLEINMNEVLIKELAKTVFNNSVTQHKNIKTYANLSIRLGKLKVNDISFRTELLNNCHQSFTQFVNDSEYDNKPKIIGCLLLLAELFNMNFVAASIIYECFSKILKTTSPLKIQLACTLMRQVYTKFKLPNTPVQEKDKIKSILELIESEGNNSKMDRDKFLVMNLISELQ